MSWQSEEEETFTLAWDPGKTISALKMSFEHVTNDSLPKKHFLTFHISIPFKLFLATREKSMTLDTLDLMARHFQNSSYIFQYIKFLLLYILALMNIIPISRFHLPFPVVSCIFTVSLQGSWHCASRWATFPFRLTIFWLFELYISCKNLQAKE